MAVVQADPIQRSARLLALSLVISLVILAAGMGWTWKVGQASNRYDHELYHTSMTLHGLQRITGQGGAK